MYKKPKFLLSKGDTNYKLAKNDLVTFGLSLAPSDQSGVINVCPKASPTCRKDCLYFAGRGAFSNVVNSRTNKTLYLNYDRDGFYSQLAEELYKIDKRHGANYCVRLNVLSDLNHLKQLKKVGLDVNNLQGKFYDYTKVLSYLEYHKLHFPNYHLTFSRSEINEPECFEALNLGYNVAVVFGNLPKLFWGLPVIDGDLNDMRFDDVKNVIVGLRAKGRMIKNFSGFVVR
jgi:hypothetical protein